MCIRDRYFYSLSDCCRKQARAAENKTTQANVGIKSIQEYLVPLTPLGEQHRIVAKVDECMNYSDLLTLKLAGAQTDRRRLLEGLLGRSLGEGPVLAEQACGESTL